MNDLQIQEVVKNELYQVIKLSKNCRRRSKKEVYNILVERLGEKYSYFDACIYLYKYFGTNFEQIYSNLSRRNQLKLKQESQEKYNMRQTKSVLEDIFREDS